MVHEHNRHCSCKVVFDYRYFVDAVCCTTYFYMICIFVITISSKRKDPLLYSSKLDCVDS